MYDAYGEEGLRGRGYAPDMDAFGSVSDLFSAFFGSGGFGDAFGGGGGRGPPARGGQGGDVVVAAAIELADAARGTQVEVSYEAASLCAHCHGNGAEPGTPIVACRNCDGTGQTQRVASTAFGRLVRTAVCEVCGGDGRVAETPCHECDGAGLVRERRRVAVDVPPGISDGQRIRLTRRGHAGQGGGPPGDLYVVVRVREDERFLRDGEDLITVIDVPAPLAALGTTVEVPTFDGAVPLEIPAGTQPGEQIVMRGRGMPPLSRGRTGDLRVVVNVAIPRRLTREQRDLLERFADTITQDNGRSDEGTLAKLKRVLAGCSGSRSACPAPRRSWCWPSCSSSRRPGSRRPTSPTRWLSTPSTARRVSCPTCRRWRRRRAGRWSTSRRPRWPTTGPTAGRRGTGPSTSRGASGGCASGPRGSRRWATRRQPVTRPLAEAEPSTSSSTPARRSGRARTTPPAFASSSCSSSTRAARSPTGDPAAACWRSPRPGGTELPCARPTSTPPRSRRRPRTRGSTAPRSRSAGSTSGTGPRPGRRP